MNDLFEILVVLFVAGFLFFWIIPILVGLVKGLMVLILILAIFFVLIRIIKYFV